jgi:hypothetical protein
LARVAGKKLRASRIDILENFKTDIVAIRRKLSGTNGTPREWTPIVRGQDRVNDIAWRLLCVGPSGDVSAVHHNASSWALALAAVQPP